jgi:hypothetical protein
MTPKEYKRARKSLTRQGILTQVGVRNGEPVYSFAPVDPAIEALAALAETAGYNFYSDPRAWVAKALRQRADLRDMPETTLLGFLAVALLKRGCDWAFDSVGRARFRSAGLSHHRSQEESTSSRNRGRGATMSSTFGDNLPS